MKLEKTRNAKDEYSIAVNGQLDLNDYIRIFTEIDGEYFEDYQTYDLVWESSDPEAVEVKDGLVTGLKANSSSMITVMRRGSRCQPELQNKRRFAGNDHQTHGAETFPIPPCRSKGARAPRWKYPSNRIITKTT